MGLFGSSKKSGESVKKLSEQEIQEKLYGRFRSPNSSSDLGIQLKPQVSPPPATDKSFLDTNRHDLFSPLNEESQLKDPFKTAIAEPQNEKNVSSGSSHKTISNLYSNRSSEPRFKEKKVIPPAPKRSFQLKIPYQKIGKSALNVAGAFFSMLFSGLRAAIHFTYTHRNIFKKAGTILLVVGLIFVLFSGVHYLNVQREKAMGEMRKAVASKVTSSEVSETNVAKPSSGAESAALSPVGAREADTAISSKASEAESLPTAMEIPAGEFVIQIATYVNEDDAQRIKEQLISANWPSFVKGFARSGAKLYYSVYIGRYASYSEAQHAFASFRKTDDAVPFQDAFIRTLKQ